MLYECQRGTIIWTQSSISHSYVEHIIKYWLILCTVEAEGRSSLAWAAVCEKPTPPSRPSRKAEHLGLFYEMPNHYEYIVQYLFPIRRSQ
jgi:hypothetical protein